MKDNIHAVSLGPATVAVHGPRRARPPSAAMRRPIARIVESVFVEDRRSRPRSRRSTPDPVDVQVQNATGTDGLATRVVSYIARKGYPVDDLNSANVFDGAVARASEVIDLDGTHEKNAYLIANWLDIDADERPQSHARRTRRHDQPADAEIVVILGE